MSTKLSIRTLVVEGHLAGVRPGTSRAQVRTLLGAPDDALPQSTLAKSRTWNYGNFEIHFENDVVWMIANDRVYDIKAGPRRELDTWTLNGYRGLYLGTIVHQLKVEGVQFFLGKDDMNRRVLRVFDGAQLTFDTPSEGDDVLGSVAVMLPARQPRFRPDRDGTL